MVALHPLPQRLGIPPHSTGFYNIRTSHGRKSPRLRFCPTVRRMALP